MATLDIKQYTFKSLDIGAMSNESPSFHSVKFVTDGSEP